jgi:hypothetical protein
MRTSALGPPGAPTAIDDGTDVTIRARGAGVTIERLDRSRYELEVEDTFLADRLDASLWIPHYLPQWASRERTLARFDVGGGQLRLRIDADQAPWSPEWNEGIRVSNLQTGVFSGPVGSRIGQHHFRPDLVVREAQEPRSLYTPRYGLIELTARATADPACLVALWLIGFEDDPRRSGEICVMEVFGRDVDPRRVRVGMGVHPFGDPSMIDDFEQVPVAVDALELHTYSVEWTPDRVGFYVDDVLLKVTHESPAYPMQVMLNIYELSREPAAGRAAGGGAYPKRFRIQRFGGYRPVSGPGARPPAWVRSGG